MSVQIPSLADQAQMIRVLVDGHFTPESVVKAVTSGDLALLVHETGAAVPHAKNPEPA